MSGFLMREAGLGIAGPAAREVPLFGTLVAIAMMGGIAIPELRRALRGIRAAEHHIRERRTAIHGAARRPA
jgi:hypothetical protein